MKSPTKEPTDAFKKWQSNAKVSQRIQRFQRSIKEENWRELSEAIEDMKSDHKKKMSSIIDDRMDAMMRLDVEEVTKPLKTRLVELVQSEVGAIMVALLFQECPFFITRIVFMYIFKTYSRGLIFYTTKNMFMLTFLNYRLWVASQD